jgi:hypothetical protein
MVENGTDEQPKGVSRNCPPSHMNGDEVSYFFLYPCESPYHFTLCLFYEIKCSNQLQLFSPLTIESSLHVIKGCLM